jgi:DNA-binding NarL/FixJ family response regulator
MQEQNRKIIQLLAEGKTVKEVAHSIGLKKRTVHDRIQNLKRKFGAKSIAQLVVKFKTETV